MSIGKIAGWVLSVLLSVFLIFASAGGKFTDWDGKEEMFAKMGWTPEVMYNIGILEVIVALLFLIPQTAFLGTILLTAYMGGAVATHVRVSDPFVFQVMVGVVAWIAYGLRDPRVFQMLLPNRVGKPAE